MKTTRIALVSSLVLLLGGCEHMPRALGGGGTGVRLAPIHCSVATCTIPVQVTNECAVEVAEELHTGPGPDVVTIRWKIQGPGEFQMPKGIDFRGNGKFRLVSSSPSEYVFAFANKPKGGKHKYDVNVKRGANCGTWDPFVMN